MGRDANWRVEKFGLRLIDFGRAIHTSHFSPLTRFVGKEEHVTEYQYPPAREGASWSFEVDVFGLAGVLNLMQFGEYLNMTVDENGDAKPDWMARRSQRRGGLQIWENILSKLIGFRCNESIPLSDAAAESVQCLSECRHMIRTYLEENPRMDSKIRTELMKQYTELATAYAV